MKNIVKFLVFIGAALLLGGSSLRAEAAAPLVTVDMLLTNNSKPTITGTIDQENADILVKVNNIDYSATNNKDGTWKLDGDAFLSPLSDGTYDVIATATNADSEVGTDVTVDELKIDTVPPVIDGITEGLITKNDVSASFAEGTGILDGEAYISGTAISSEGNHTLVVTDEAENSTTIHFTIDKTAPVISGVNEGAVYNHDLNPTFNEGSAKLNGANFDSGGAVTEEGEYALVVTDEAGNSLTVHFSINKTVPNLTVTPQFSSPTNSGDVSFKIKTDSGAAIEIKNGAEVLYSGTGDGSDQTVIITLGEGSYNLIVSSTNEAENSITVSLNEFAVDLTDPEVEAGADISENSQFVRTAVASDQNGIKNMVWEKTFGPGEITFGSSDQLETTIFASEDGEYVIRITVTDFAGNTSSDDFKLTWSTAGPIINVTIDPAGNVSNTDRTITIDYGSSVTKEYKLDDNDWVAYLDPIVVSEEGEHSLLVRGNDELGNTTALEEINFKIDKTAPTVSGVSNGETVNHDVTATFNDGTATLDNEPYNSSDIISSEGEHVLVVTDEAGNKSEIHFTIDKSAPVVSGAENGEVTNTDVVITFDSGAATLDGDEFVSGETITAEGTHHLIVIDEAGNASEIVFKIDKTAPTISGVTEEQISTDPLTISFSEGTAKLDGQEFFSGDTVSAIGIHTLIVTDEAGNASEVTFTITKKEDPNNSQNNNQTTNTTSEETTVTTTTTTTTITTTTTTQLPKAGMGMFMYAVMGLLSLFGLKLAFRKV